MGGKNLSEFNEDLIKKYDEDSNTGYFLEVDVGYPKDLSNFHKDLPFLPKSRKTCLRYKRKICRSYKSFKTNIKSLYKIKRGTQSNLI